MAHVEKIVWLIILYLIHSPNVVVCYSVQNLKPIFSFDLRQSLTHFWGQNDPRLTSEENRNKTNSLPENFKVLLEENGHFYIGGRNRLYNVSISSDGSITEHKHLEWDVPTKKVQACTLYYSLNDCQNYIMLVARITPDKLLVCGTFAFEPKCRNYQYSQNQAGNDGDYIALSPEIDGIGYVPFNPFQNFTYTVVDGEIYAGTFVDVWSEQPIIYRQPVRTVHEFPPALNGPQFRHSFRYGNYMYFIFTEWSGGSFSTPDRYHGTRNDFSHGATQMGHSDPVRIVQTRIARVCLNDTGYLDLIYDNPLIWKTYLKARLACTVPNNYEQHTSQSPYIFPSYEGSNVDAATAANYRRLKRKERVKGNFKGTYPNAFGGLVDDPRDRRDLTEFTYDTIVSVTSPLGSSAPSFHQSPNFIDDQIGRFYATFTEHTPPGTIPSSALCAFDMANVERHFEQGITYLQNALAAKMNRGLNNKANSNTVDQQQRLTPKLGECAYNLVKPEEAEFVQNHPLLPGIIGGVPLTVWSRKLPSALLAHYFEERQRESDENAQQGGSDYSTSLRGLEEEIFQSQNGSRSSHATFQDLVFLGTKDGTVIKIAVNYKAYHHSKSQTTTPTIASPNAVYLSNVRVSESLTLTQKSSVLNDSPVTGLHWVPAAIKDSANSQVDNYESMARLLVTVGAQNGGIDSLVTVPVSRCSLHRSCSACFYASLGDSGCVWSGELAKCVYQHPSPLITTQSVRCVENQREYYPDYQMSVEKELALENELGGGNLRHLDIKTKNQGDDVSFITNDNSNSFITHDKLIGNRDGVLDVVPDDLLYPSKYLDRVAMNGEEPISDVIQFDNFGEQVHHHPRDEDLRGVSYLRHGRRFNNNFESLCSAINAKNGPYSSSTPSNNYQIYFAVIGTAILCCFLGFLIGTKTRCTIFDRFCKGRDKKKERGGKDSVPNTLGCDDLMIMNSLHRHKQHGILGSGANDLMKPTNFGGNESNMWWNDPNFMTVLKDYHIQQLLATTPNAAEINSALPESHDRSSPGEITKRLKEAWRFLKLKLNNDASSADNKANQTTLTDGFSNPNQPNHNVSTALQNTGSGGQGEILNMQIIQELQRIFHQHYNNSANHTNQFAHPNYSNYPQRNCVEASTGFNGVGAYGQQRNHYPPLPLPPGMPPFYNAYDMQDGLLGSTLSRPVHHFMGAPATPQSASTASHNQQGIYEPPPLPPLPPILLPHHQLLVQQPNTTVLAPPNSSQFLIYHDEHGKKPNHATINTTLRRISSTFGRTHGHGTPQVVASQQDNGQQMFANLALGRPMDYGYSSNYNSSTTPLYAARQNYLALPVGSSSTMNTEPSQSGPQSFSPAGYNQLSRQQPMDNHVKTVSTDFSPKGAQTKSPKAITTLVATIAALKHDTLNTLSNGVKPSVIIPTCEKDRDHHKVSRGNVSTSSPPPPTVAFQEIKECILNRFNPSLPSSTNEKLDSTQSVTATNTNA